MNQNIEKHNKKFQVGEIVQGAKILKILKYSKNGKSTEFLFECPICHEPFVCNASAKKKKICLKCQGVEDYDIKNKIPESKTNNSNCFEIQKLPREVIGGIYKIEYDNVVYIGETFNFRKRWNAHIKALQEGTHYNFLLQNYYNKHRVLKFEVLESFVAKDFQKAWDKFKPYIKIINLIKESEIIDKQEDSNHKVINIERTYEIVAMDCCIIQMVKFLKENKITNYDELLKYPVKNYQK